MKMPAAKTFPAIMDEMAQRFGDRNFLTDHRRRVTYAEFRAETRRLAKGFHALGVRKDDKVAILWSNDIEWLMIDFAIASLGAVLVAVNTWWRQSELHHALGSTDSSVLVMVDRYIGNDYTASLRELGDLSKSLPQLKHIIGQGEDLLPGTIPFADLYSMGQDVPDEVIDRAAAAVQPQDTVYLLFTSGSTARSKAVEMVHRDCIENPHGIGENMHLTEQDRVMLPTSMFWSLSCVNCLFAAMTHGCSIVILYKFEAGEMLRLIEQEECTAVYTLPNIAIALHSHPDRHTRNLSKWRTGHGRPNIQHLMYEMGAKEMITGYGLTECYGNSVQTNGHDPIEKRMRNTGYPLPNTELHIVDPKTHQILPNGEMGEIRLRGYVTPRYYKNPERTREAIDDDGWFYTGDIGVIEEDGTLTFKGRFKEMIKTGGINVTPADVEDLLHNHPAVLQAIVVGVPDPKRDEIVAAMVVPKPGAKIDIDELVAYCRKTAAIFKVPRYIEVIGPDEVPLTDTGKVHKIRAREIMTEKYQAQMAKTPTKGVA
jgi:fatty-acyl-CoA synthase